MVVVLVVVVVVVVGVVGCGGGLGYMATMSITHNRASSNQLSAYNHSPQTKTHFLSGAAFDLQRKVNIILS